MGIPSPEGGDEEFLALIRQIRAGSQEAAWELVDRYGPSVLRTVRRVLNKRLRSRFDSMDFVQLVWSSFFRDPRKLAQLERPEDLAAFLVGMAHNKVGFVQRGHLYSQMREIRREIPISEGVMAQGSDLSGREPEPFEVAIAREQWDRMMRDEPEHYRRVVDLRLAGRTFPEIADSVGLAVSTVHGILKKLADKIA